MTSDTSKLSLGVICAVLLWVSQSVIYDIFVEDIDFSSGGIFTIVTFLFFAILQAFLLTRDKRIWHIILPLMLSLILLRIHIFDRTYDGYEVTAMILRIFAPPVYELMSVLFDLYDTMSFPNLAYTITSGFLMSVGAMLYKILIYWCVLKLSNYLQCKFHSISQRAHHNK